MTDLAEHRGYLPAGNAGAKAVAPAASGEAGHRLDIDGMRALAIVPVLFFHLGSEVLKGGYIGVDVFFVISGYLITGMIRVGDRPRADFPREVLRSAHPAHLSRATCRAAGTTLLSVSPSFAVRDR